MAAGGTPLAAIGAAHRGVDREVLLQGPRRHRDFLDDLIPQAHWGVHANIEHAADFTLHGNRYRNDRVQAFVLDHAVVLVGNGGGTRVVRYAHRAAGGDDAPADAHAGIDKQIL